MAKTISIGTRNYKEGSVRANEALAAGGTTGDRLDTVRPANQPLSRTGATPQPVAPTTASPSTYVPRYTNSATSYDEPSPVVPKSPEAIQEELMKGAQGEINALRDYERSLLQQQSVINQQNDRATSSISTLSGLAGSTEANTAQQQTTAQGQKANEKIQAEIAMRVQGVLQNVRTSSLQEARAQREEARLDEASRIKNREARQKESVAQLSNLAASGVTFEGLKGSDPKAFQYLAQQFGGEQALKGAFVLNTPQDQIIDKKLEGGKYIVARQNPITGKINVETVDLGLPVGFSKTVDAGDRILAIPDNWDGDPSKLVTINKGLTPGQAQKPPGGADTSPYANDIDAIIGATISTIPSKFGQATFQSQIAKARNDADKINLVAAQVLKGQPAEMRTDFAHQAAGITEVDKALAELDNGVKTGVINNTLQYTYNLAGKDFDPKLAKIQSHIVAAIQPYRNSVTGAAWGAQEEAEYQALFGSTKFSPPELKQRLLNLKDILKTKSASGLNTFVNPLGVYDNQFETGALGSDVRSRAEAAGYDYDAMRNDGLSDEEIAQSL